MRSEVVTGREHLKINFYLCKLKKKSLSSIDTIHFTQNKENSTQNVTESVLMLRFPLPLLTLQYTAYFLVSTCSDSFHVAFFC